METGSVVSVVLRLCGILALFRLANDADTFEFSIACRVTRSCGMILHVHDGVRVDHSVSCFLTRLLMTPPVG